MLGETLGRVVEHRADDPRERRGRPNKRPRSRGGSTIVGSVGNWDWPDLYNRRRPGGVSSLPDDGQDGPQNLNGEAEPGKAKQSPSRARAQRRRERNAARGDRGRPLQESAQPGGESSIDASPSSAPAAAEPAPSPAVLAQVAALRNAAARGDAFCEE